MRRVLPTHDTHDDYRVGWVCVLPSELNASRALLDEEHDPLPAEDGDDNGYLLGRMGKHNVVIVYPSAYGTSRRPAAEIVANMLRTFRNVRFALMVGVGGGVPKQPHSKDPRKDIRLGDVVVSVSGDGHGKLTSPKSPAAVPSQVTALSVTSSTLQFHGGSTFF